jgi:hypothetical protein
MGGAASGEWAIDAYADASLLLTAQSGMVVLLNGMLVFGQSVKQRKRATNSTKAETEATHDAVDVVVVLLVFALELGVRPKATVWIDPLNLVRLIGSFHVNPTEESLRPQLVLLQELLDGETRDRYLRARACRDQGVWLYKDDEWAKFETEIEKVGAQRAKKPGAESIVTLRSVLALRDKLDEVFELSAIPTTRIELRHIPGNSNPADCMTKPMSVDAV